MKETDVKVIYVDEQPYAVDTCSDEIKELVEILNVWRHQERDAKIELHKLNLAQQQLSQQVVTQVRKEQEEAKNPPATAKAEVDTPPTIEETTDESDDGGTDGSD